MELINQNKGKLGIAPLCESLGVSRAAYYRSSHKRPRKAATGRTHPRRIPDEQRAKIRSILNSERFCDMAPAAIYATMLDEGIYLASERSLYRILSESNQNRPRHQRAPRSFVKPELLATKPNEVWSWDITKLKGPVKWTYYYLYKIMDIFSRYIVGWMIADRESGPLAEALIAETCLKQDIVPESLILHSDHGASMIANCVARLLADLGITRSLSRPHVSNDNPYSESAFKTLKYRPGIPRRFACQKEAEDIFFNLFHWYNHEHHHSGIAMLTPYQVHYNEHDVVLQARKVVLEKAFQDTPERFVRGCPKVQELPQEVWINKPILKRENDKK